MREHLGTVEEAFALIELLQFQLQSVDLEVGQKRAN